MLNRYTQWHCATLLVNIHCYFVSHRSVPGVLSLEPSVMMEECPLVGHTFILSRMQTAVLQYHSGYTLSELSPLVRRLYAMLASPADENLRAVENKYSHKYVMQIYCSNEIFWSEFEYLIYNLLFLLQSLLWSCKNCAGAHWDVRGGAVWTGLYSVLKKIYRGLEICLCCKYYLLFVYI